MNDPTYKPETTSHSERDIYDGCIALMQELVEAFGEYLEYIGYDPYVMVYNKPSAPTIIRHLQRWCNNKIIFKSCPNFEDYNKIQGGDIEQLGII